MNSHILLSTKLWTPSAPEDNIFSGWSYDEIKAIMGTNVEEEIPKYLPTTKETSLKDIPIPESFNTREEWPMCQSDIRDQA